ncbi:hypothetical protein [Bradyrhizobium sp. RD5-C2]|uniref:hypothetical protein n=1 Tax=Bradyrhizobium sp. RD5-C2 TaxID=244562 RepID=UPI001CC75192|nr:hypothetical protein [Bradyrhizobium sp. RD5-C2]GIQ73979.1 hypothetical protein BraRD5C2_24170 [Bradyrhizobium sp. RD5-C2]
MNSPSGAEQSPTGSGAENSAAHWRADIASLVFPLPEHGAICAVHRGALRTLLGADPTPEGCLGYFARFEGAFRAAASAKILRKRIPLGTNLHLTSRDIARKLLEADQIECGERP